MFDGMLCPNQMTSRIDDAIASLEAEASDAAIVGLLCTDFDPRLPGSETLRLLVQLRRQGAPLLDGLPGAVQRIYALYRSRGMTPSRYEVDRLLGASNPDRGFQEITRAVKLYLENTHEQLAA